MAYSEEQRRAALETFARFGHSYADTISELGHPNRGTLRGWWRECERTGAVPVRKSISDPSEPCQYNGQRNRRFLCGQHGFRIGLEGILEAAGELLHGLCRHAVPDGFVWTEAAAAWLDELDRPVLRRGCIRQALMAVPLVLQRPEERL